jgi:hypothetical protein
MFDICRLCCFRGTPPIEKLFSALNRKHTVQCCLKNVLFSGHMAYQKAVFCMNVVYFVQNQKASARRSGGMWAEWPFLTVKSDIGAQGGKLCGMWLRQGLGRAPG